MNVISTGITPEKIECGSRHFTHTPYADGRMRCYDCGLVCFSDDPDDR